MRTFRIILWALVIAAACPDYAIQVSDRRLTRVSRSGRIELVEDEENKAIFWDLPTARLAVGYTGVSRIGRQSTAEFLCDQLLAAGEHGNAHPLNGG